MIASSLKEEDGLVDLLLGKGADATIPNNSGQVTHWLSYSSSPVCNLSLIYMSFHCFSFEFPLLILLFL